MAGTCKIDGCEKPCFGHGWCETHYGRWRRQGDPLRTIKAEKGALLKWLKDHVNYSGDECLKWPFGKNAGRGSVSGHKGRLAHRIMCILVHGEPPTIASEAAHSCGKGHEGCVNPKHLRWATHAENAADMVRHGTSVRGTRHGGAKLDEAKAAQIRLLCENGEISQSKIAAIFDISQALVSLVATNKSWRPSAE